MSPRVKIISICPECGKPKDKRTKICKFCFARHQSDKNKICPYCGEKKDYRADACVSCRMKINHPRKGKGKQEYLNKCGYLMRQIDNKGSYVHRLVMEEYLGRKLEDGEVVHHIDGNKINNDIENLELLLKQEHHKLHSPKEKMKEMSKLAHAKRRRK